MKTAFIHTIKQVPSLLKLPKEEHKKLRELLKRHPMRIPPYYYDLIDFKDEQDPIAKMAIPSLEELSHKGEWDTSGEKSNTRFSGLQHKYKQTVLVLCTNVCFMYCRHCFRKRMVGYSNEEISKRMDQAVEYIRNHQEVTNVLITGGDAFTMSNHQIEQYLSALSKIDHLQYIRFGTRSLVVKPGRIVDDIELQAILKRYSQQKQVIIVTQYNHPREITDSSKQAIKALLDAGCRVLNQAVLLKGINDDPHTLVLLLIQLTANGIQPYYVFQCRPVKGATHFQVPLVKGIEIVNEARKELSGVSKAFRYVMSHPKGKIEIIGVYENQMIFKFHQSKDNKHHNLIFMKDIQSDAVWLDGTLQPF